MDEKQQFSARLKAAMKAAGLDGRVRTLETLFNLKYQGKSVSYQGIRYWLIGKTIPDQDKLVVLADLLDIDAQELRYGSKPGRSRIAEQRPAWPGAMDANDRAAVEAYLRLPPRGRKAVREVIHALAGDAKGKSTSGV